MRFFRHNTNFAESEVVLCIQWEQFALEAAPRRRDGMCRRLRSMLYLCDAPQAPPPAPPTFASMVAAPPRNPPPMSTATTWQEKINGLFGKKTTPEKRNALAVTSATKEPLDVPSQIAAVSVSLPQQYETEVEIGVGCEIEDGVSIAKQVEEAEEIFEDREIGSLPVVRVPNMAPPAAWLAAPPPDLLCGQESDQPVRRQRHVILAG